jgi:hypothetical protein
MSCTASELMETMDSFSGGSDGRYRHRMNPKFIYTEGVKEATERAEAGWLVDTMALAMAPIYAKAWLAGKAGIGIVTLVVRTAEEIAAAEKDPTALVLPVARVELSLVDDEPPAYAEDIPYTDFPEGKWNFYFGTDEIGPDQYVTTVCLPQEY